MLHFIFLISSPLSHRGEISKTLDLHLPPTKTIGTFPIYVNCTFCSFYLNTFIDKQMSMIKLINQLFLDRCKIEISVYL